MNKLLLLLLAAMLALPAFAEDAAPIAEPTPVPQTDSIVEGYIPPAKDDSAQELPPLRDDPMLQHVVEIAHRLDLLAENKLFASYYIPVSIPTAAVEAVSYGDHTRPMKVYHLNGGVFIDALYAGADPALIPDFTRTELRRDLVGELPNLLWGKREETELYLLTLLARFKIFASNDAEGCGIFFLLYEDASPVMVTWEAYNGCVSVAAYFMPDAKLAAVSDTEAMSAWFASFGLPFVPFEEVPLT